MATPYLTIPETAAELAITPSGVYKLIKRGRLPAVRLSEHSLRVSRLALEAYQRRLRGEVNLPPIKLSSKTAAELRVEFEADTGLSPAEWERRWQAETIEDTAENMRLAIRAMSLLLHGGAETPAARSSTTTR